MKEVEGLAIKYIGYNAPSTKEEVELEILGLQTAIAAAKQRIAVLTQSVKLQELMKQSMTGETTDEAVQKTSETEKTK